MASFLKRMERFPLGNFNHRNGLFGRFECVPKDLNFLSKIPLKEWYSLLVHVMLSFGRFIEMSSFKSILTNIIKFRLIKLHPQLSQLMRAKKFSWILHLFVGIFSRICQLIDGKGGGKKGHFQGKAASFKKLKKVEEVIKQNL